MTRSRISQIIPTAAKAKDPSSSSSVVLSLLQVPLRKADPAARLLPPPYQLFIWQREEQKSLFESEADKHDEMFTFAGLFRKSSCVWMIGPFSCCRFSRK